METRQKVNEKFHGHKTNENGIKIIQRRDTVKLFIIILFLECPNGSSIKLK